MVPVPMTVADTLFAVLLGTAIELGEPLEEGDELKVVASMTGANVLLLHKRVFYNAEGPCASTAIRQR